MPTLVAQNERNAMKLRILIALIFGGLLLPFEARAQDYDVQGYSDAYYGAGSALFGYPGGMGFKNPAAKGQYYTFGKYLGAELGNIGNVNGPSNPYAFSSTNRNLLGVGTLPIGSKFSLFGRFGLARSSSDYAHNLSVPSYLGERNPDLKYGIGLKYNYNPNFNMRLGWDLYNNPGLEDFYSGQSEARWFSLGFGVKF
jgi:hypothetical protein